MAEQFVLLPVLKIMQQSEEEEDRSLLMLKAKMSNKNCTIRKNVKKRKN
jgi:hypothetical protein